MKTMETRIAETMGSLDNISRAQCDPEVLDKVLSKLDRPGPEKVRLTASMAWKLAACLVVLIAVNVFILLNSSGGQSEQVKAKAAATEYFSYLDHYNI
jgi:hypothetical protein